MNDNNAYSQSEAFLRAELGISPETLRSLAQKSNLRAGLEILKITLSIVAVFALYLHFPNIFVFFLCFVLIAALQHHLHMVQHEAIHYLLFSNKRLNEFFGNLCGCAVGFSMAYRRNHFSHHKHLGRDGDPDLVNFKNFPNTVVFVCRSFLSDVLFFNAFIKYFFLNFPRNDYEKKISITPTFSQISFLAIVQLAIFGLFVALDHPWLYLTLWLLPLVTLGKLFAHLRNVAEHVKNADVEDSILSRLRTIRCGILESFFLAPLNFNYHAEHHLYPYIPFYNLPQAHREFSQRPAYQKYIDIQNGYLKTLFRRGLIRTASVH